MPHPPLMIPEVGKGQEKIIQNTVDSCEHIAKEISSSDVDTIIVVTPHGVMFRDAVAIITKEKRMFRKV